jgi:hypothetical protein
MAKKAKKTKNGKTVRCKSELWVAPTFSLKQTPRQSDWNLPVVKPTESNRFLELADVALGLDREKLKNKRAG